MPNRLPLEGYEKVKERTRIKILTQNKLLARIISTNESWTIFIPTIFKN